ncbi:hypothetical protein C2845_PM05G14910 [Panicum miliaceum]|uniref:Uncharacterized protein n=1 Tax=Panicum miliaceum TaxID=4540 RepID=A0A3L6SWH9_PANMI|nr:hypothetical protein C2845_PM05G14910 [Panicum miliaceum]
MYLLMIFLKKNQRFMSDGGKPDVTAKDCMEMLKELNVTNQRLEKHMNMTDQVMLVLFGFTVGALTAIGAENMSNKQESSKTADEVTKTKDQLERGMSLLKRTEASIAELKELVRSGAAESPGSEDKTPPSSST